jgi:NADH-quinone oxidoreductase subunit C
MSLEETIASLKTHFGDKLEEPVTALGETTLTLKDPAILPLFAKILKHDHHFEMLVDVCSIDHVDVGKKPIGGEPIGLRFEVVYHVYSFRTGERLRFKVRVPESGATLPSLTGIWKAADWHEREVFDMMGIHFEDHPDLRRILMWEGYPYYPLRKEFPLAGRHTEDTNAAPMDGGPFVSQPGAKLAIEREPRAKGETDRHGRKD